MRLVIDRKRWIRDMLTDGEGGYCAIGAYMVQCCGLGPGLMRGICFSTEARELLCQHPWLQSQGMIENPDGPDAWPKELTIRNAIVWVNNGWPDGPERDQKLTDLFGKVGVDVEFTN